MTDWATRQQHMSAWYRDLMARPDEAAAMYEDDYGPYRPFLAACRGDVLDVGSGAGVVRHFLPADVRYVGLDPSADWLGADDVAVLRKAFPGMGRRVTTVRGVGERLPFRDGAFDVALALWSLNHAADPPMLLREVHRVLRPAAPMLLVLEDMEPGWADLARMAWREKRPLRKLTGAKLAKRFGRAPWPVQDDHLPITAGDVAAWTEGRFALVRRRWLGFYATFELVRARRP